MTSASQAQSSVSHSRSSSHSQCSAHTKSPSTSLGQNRFSILLSCLILSLSLLPTPSLAFKVKWIKGRITWYGEPSGAGTTSGACGYGNTFKYGYNYMTAAASNTLYTNGKSCGACFLVKCRSHSKCNRGKSVVVTVTNLCPPNGWCKEPQKHLDMSHLPFSIVADPQAGVVPAFLRRVPCQRDGGVVFTMFGNPWFIMALITNVAGSGDVSSVAFRVPGSPWKPLYHNYGAIWTAAGGGYLGKPITVRLKSQFTKQKVVIMNAIPSSWSFGGDYKSGRNFPRF